MYTLYFVFLRSLLLLSVLFWAVYNNTVGTRET